METIDFSKQKKILTALAGKIDNFYLAGGTALSLMYFEHRASYDLDFFTRVFRRDEITQTVSQLEKELTVPMKLQNEQLKEGLSRILVYTVHFDDQSLCKVDFVEDFIDLIKPFKRVDGINVLSLEDIYLRKIFTVAGHVKSIDMIGQDMMIGGRQDAKDLYDLFCLSTITTPLSKFVVQQKDEALVEGVIRWYRTFDRMAMKTGLLDLAVRREISFRMMEHHFKEEIDQLITQQIGG